MSAGNAHRSRHGNVAGCKFCEARPAFGKYRNTNGHRHNPTHKRRGKRKKQG